MRRATVAVLAFFFLGTLVSGQSGQGLGVAGKVEIQDGQRGQTYHATLDVQNSDSTASTITVAKSGETGSWTTTQPADTFEIPANGRRAVDVAVAVPNDAPNGFHTGQLTFTSASKGTVTGGPGSSTSPGIGIRLNVTVGGTATTILTWTAARAEDVPVGTPLRVLASLRNDGNVRATGTAEATVRALGSEVEAARGTVSIEVEPGATREGLFVFDAALPLGQYLAHVSSTSPAGFERDVEFVVHPPGVVPKHGTLVALHHPATVETGRPVRLVAEFRNVGNQSIAQAKVSIEVFHGETLVAAVDGDPRVVSVGATGNLTVFWTPSETGEHRLVAKVAYDGYETPPLESTIGVRAATTTLLTEPWVLGGIIAALVMVILFLLFRRKKKKQDPPSTGPGTPHSPPVPSPIVPPIPPRERPPT